MLSIPLTRLRLSQNISSELTYNLFGREIARLENEESDAPLRNEAKTEQGNSYGVSS